MKVQGASICKLEPAQYLNSVLWIMDLFNGLNKQNGGYPFTAHNAAEFCT